MGKKPQWSAAEWEAWHASSSSQHGGWNRAKGRGKDAGNAGQQPRWPKGEGKGPRSNGTAFPSFEAMDAGGTGARSSTRTRDRMEADEDANNNPQVARGVQRVLNGLRKAEGKARRLEEERTELERKWNVYRQELQQTFIQEKRRFQDRLSKLSQDLQEAEQAQEDALLELQGALLEPQAATRNKPQEDNTEAIEELEALLKSPERPTTGIADMLMGAMQGGDREARRRQILQAIEADQGTQGRDPIWQQAGGTNYEDHGGNRADRKEAEEISDDPTDSPRMDDGTNNQFLMLAFSACPAWDLFFMKQYIQLLFLAYKTTRGAPPDNGYGCRVYDLLDCIGLLLATLQDGFLRWASVANAAAQGWCNGFLLFQTGALLSLLAVPVCRPAVGRRPAHKLFMAGHAKTLIVFMLLQPAGAMQNGWTNRPHDRTTHSVLSPVPKPTDLELWAAGQLTMREQLIRANTARILGAPLGHSEGEIAPPTLEARIATADDDPAPLNEDDRRAVHVTVWIATPHFSSTVVDLGIAFPLTEQRLCDAVIGTCTELPDYIETVIPTVPQLASHFGSCLAVPSWVPAVGKTVLLMDSRGIGGELFAFYHEGPLTVHSLGKQLPEDSSDYDLYLFGSHNPLQPHATQPAIQGGIVKAVFAGDHCTWEDALQTRLLDPTRWNPRLNPPGNSQIEHAVYQSPEDQLVYEEILGSDDLREDLAERIMLFSPGQCCTAEPTRPAEDLYHAGRRITKQIAVIPGPRSTPEDDPDTTVIFADLRGLGFFPQWILLPGPFFDSSEYLEGIQAPVVEGWTIMVEGGELTSQPEILRVNNGELLVFFLKETAELSSSPASHHDSDLDTDGDQDGDRDGHDPPPEDPDSADLMGSSPPSPDMRGRSPQGPPPPSPVNRSRSPRPTGHPRRHGDEQNSGLSSATPAASTTLSLATVIPPPVFDIALESLAMPHTLQDITEMMRPNPVSAALSTGAKSRDSPRNVLMSLFGVLGEPLLGASFCPWGPTDAPALQAEQAAIVMALLWLGQSLHFLQASDYILHFDCQAAGWSADGTFACCNPLAVRTRHLESYLQEITNHRLKFAYVRAHDAHAWNDLADTVAKAASQQAGNLPGPPHRVIEHFLCLDLSWAAACLYGGRHGSLPMFAGQHLRWDPGQQRGASPLSPEELIPVQVPSTGPPGKARRMQIKATTINIQGIKGKYKYISDQLAQARYQTVFFQELKDAEGLCRTGDYLRLHTDSQSHWGVGIWLNRRIGFATIAGQPVRAETEDIHVLHSEPRLLLIAVRKFQKRFLLFSGHCPHTGRPQERDAFLHLFRSLLKQAGEAYMVLGGLDLNGRPPPNYSFVTGSLQHGEPDEAGEQLAQSCLDIGLWIPATFGEIHIGTTTTYVHPSGGEHRLDFVLAGGHHHSTEARSWTDLDVDTGNRQEDHRAASLQLHGHFDGARDTPRLLRPRYDRQKMLSAEGKAILAQAYRDYVPPSWETHIDAHCQHFQGFIADVWAWRELKLSLKKRTAYRKDLWKTLLQAAFSRWAGDTTVDLAPAARIDGLLYEVTATAIGIATARIKREIYQAKDKFLKGLIADGAYGTTDFLRKMKQHGIGGRKARSAFKPLPCLLQPDGQPVVDRSAQDVLWLTHFGQQELGEVISTVDFLQQKVHKCAGIEEVEWTLAGLPTVEQVESVLRAVPRGKAPGIDGLPGEAFAAAPQALGLAMHSLVTKCMLGMQQPIQWRGGILYAAYKGKGPTSDVDSHRSLYVSSIPGKAFHRLLRDQNQECLQRTLHGLHLGSRKHSPIQFASLYLLSIFRKGARRKISTGALFLDTRSAYYRVAREIATGPICDDYTIARIFKHFELDGEDIHDLYSIIRAGGLLLEAGTPSMLTAAVRDIHHKTWAISACSTGQHVASSTAGSRPGESFADAIFAFVYGRVLGQIAEILDGEGVLSYGSYDSSTGILGSGTAGDQHLLRDATWADDSSFPLQDECPHRLVRKACRASSVVLSRCRSFGMCPNLAPGKTALVLALRGRGSQKARREHFSQDGKTLLLDDLQLRIPIVPQYVHLGGVLDMHATGKAEQRRRLALAQSSYDSGKRLLYQNKTIPLRTRAQIFEVSVLASLFNLAQFLPDDDVWNRLTDGYSRIVRKLLATHVAGDQLFHIPLPIVHLSTGCWQLCLHARRARLSLLSSLVCHGPEALWAVIQAEESWATVVRDDLRRLAAVQPGWPGDRPEDWPAWWHSIRENPGRFKLRVKHMLRKEHEALMATEAVQVGLWTMYRKASARLPLPPKPQSQWVCRACDRGFATKARLSVHYFKTHGRVSRHRLCTVGTDCRACGGRYWTHARLHAHLATSPGCVETLIAKGLTTAEPLPGRVSKRWRQLQLEQFTWQPVQHGDPESAVDNDAPRDAAVAAWTAEMNSVYRALCDYFVNGDAGQPCDQVRQVLREAMAQQPLYRTEEHAILERVADDARLLQQDVDFKGQYDSLCEVLIDPEAVLSHPVNSPDPHDKVSNTFREFDRAITTIDWSELITASQKHGTHEQVLIHLNTGWEAEELVRSGTWETSAVLRQPYLIVPEKIREAWDRVLEARYASLCAPDVFWASPFAVPFRSLPADMQPN
ncbi:unnamed protein product [Symbiodinium sp. CCMP2592]|nr:unnamed protein product [Symbiodinium sp. CCMP2592]